MSSNDGKLPKEMLVARGVKDIFKKIGQKIESVVQRVIQIAKNILSDDCDVIEKKKIIDMWAQKNNQIIDKVSEKLDIDEQDVGNEIMEKTKSPDSGVAVDYDVADALTPVEDADIDVHQRRN